MKKKTFFYNDLKEKSFVYFNILTENLQLSNMLGNFILLLNFLQKMGLIFQVTKSQLKSFDVFGNILFEYFNLFLPINISYETGLAILFEIFYWFFLGFLVFQITYVIMMFNKMKKYELTKFDSFIFGGLSYYKYINLISVYIYFIPQFSLICFGIQCSLSHSQSDDLNQNSCEFFTWPIFTLNLIQLIFVVIIQFLHSLLSFNTETQWENSLAYSYSPFHITYVGYEIFLVILAFSGSYFLIFNILILFFQFSLIYFLLNHHVFHNPSIERSEFVLLCGETFLIIYFELIGMLEYYSTLNTIFCFNILLILIFIKVIKVAKRYYENYVENLITLDTGEISLETLIDKKIKFYFFYIMTQDILQQEVYYKFDDYPSFLIRGFQEFHREHCKYAECLCKNKKSFIYDYSIRGEYIINKEKPSKNLNNLIYIKHLLMNIYYVFASNKRKKSIFLRLNMAAFLFYQLKNFHKAVVECLDIKINENPHILHEILLKRLMRDIDKFQFNLDRNKWDIPEYSSLDFASLMRIENNYLVLKNEIKNFITDYVNFLSELTQDHPNINALEKLSLNLYLARLEIDKIFLKNSQNPVSIRLYIEYLSNLIFSDDLKKPYEKDYLQKLELILTNQSNGKVFFELDLLYNEDSIICQMGSGKGNLGHIIKANEGMSKFVGYSIAELEFTNINILMPERIAEKHDMYLMNFMESSKGNVIYRERKIFARNKSGFIQFSTILMKPLYDYSQDIYKFVAYLQPFSSGIEFAVVDENGFIDSISKGLGVICNIVPDNFESKRLLIQSFSPNLAELFFEKQMDDEMKKNENIRKLLDKIKGPKLDNGDYICKVYTFIDGVQDFQIMIDKISAKIQKKEYHKIEEYLEDFLLYKETIEENIPNNCTFILQATLLVLYSQDKTLEMNIFCFKEVDSIYLEIPQQAYGTTTNIFKNLEYFLIMKQTLGKKKSNKSLSKDELDRMGTVSFYNSNTVKSLLTAPIDEEDNVNIYNESDDISIHMNRKLDQIFKTSCKTKHHIDHKIQKLIAKSKKTIQKQNSKQIKPQISKQITSQKSKSSSYLSHKTLTLVDDEMGQLNLPLNNELKGIIEENNKEESPHKENKENNENEPFDENNDLIIFNEEEEDGKEGEVEDNDKTDEEEKSEQENQVVSLKNIEEYSPSKISSAKNSKNFSNRNNTSLTITSKSKRFVSLFKRNMMNSYQNTKTRTIFTKQNTKISLNEKNQLIKEGNDGKNDQESDHEINRLKEKKFEEVRKQNNILFHDGKGSSVGSSNTTNVQQKKTLRESINYDYIPVSFKKILWLFSLSTILIFVSQAISTIYFQNSISNLSTSLKADQNFNALSFHMMRITNTFYKTFMMQNDFLYTAMENNEKNTVFNEFMILVKNDSNELISLLKYLEGNYQLFKDVNKNIYTNENNYSLLNNSLNLNVLKAVLLFLTNSLDLTTSNMTKINEKNSEFYFICKNINKFLQFFEQNRNFDSYNSKIVESIKQLMIIIFGLTCTVLFFMFIFRIILYKKCFVYINEIFVMLGSIPNEDLRTLQQYLKSMKIIFENTFINLNLKNDNDDKNENIDNFDEKHIWQQKTSNDKDLKNQRGILQRRTKFYKNIEFPISKILLVNIIWYLIFFLGYIGLLGLSNIFDSELDTLLEKRSFIRGDQYLFSAKALLYSLDYVAQKSKVFSESFIGLPVDEYFIYINEELPQNFNDFSISSSISEDLYTVMQNKSMCSSVTINNGENIRFFSEIYCDHILDGVLNIGIMAFLKDFYTCLAQINFENQNLSIEEIRKYLQDLKYTQYSEGLEYVIWPLDNYKEQYRNQESDTFNQKLFQINIFIILELIAIASLVVIYWLCFLKPLKKRLIFCRKSFFHIPFAVLNQQVRILKYINTTGNLLLKKK